MKTNDETIGRGGNRTWLSMAAVAVACLALGCAAGSGSQGPGTGQPDEGPGRGNPRGPAGVRLGPEAVLEVKLLSTHPTESLPVVRRNSDYVLSLTFEVPGDRSEFYSVRFLPADREWNVSTAPEEGILPAPDEITDYVHSSDLDFPYIQYKYEFPNSRVEFYRSGNFILEVLDIDRRVLFDRRFFVTDNEVEFNIATKSTSLITDRPDELIPEAGVAIPTEPWFGTEDVSVCFMKNGWMDEILCSEIVRVEGSRYIFEAPRKFRRTIPVQFVNLAATGGVRRRDDITIPVSVSLFVDDLRFWGDDHQWSSPVPRPAAGYEDAGIRYVDTIFALRGLDQTERPILVGTFNDWDPDAGHRLKWNPSEGLHMLKVPLKEDEMFYSYVWDDIDNARAQSKFEGPDQVVFNVFVYAKDSRYPTERLLGIGNQVLPE